MAETTPARDTGAFRRALRSRRVQERFVHLAYYEGMLPEQSMLLGLGLTAAARRALRERS